MRQGHVTRQIAGMTSSKMPECRVVARLKLKVKQYAPKTFKPIPDGHAK